MLYDYRNTLRKELERRLLKNPSYSLRSLARDVDVPVSRLSEVLNNKKGTSLTNGTKICKNLNLSRFETQRFLLSIEALHSRSPNRREQARIELLESARGQETNFLNEDKFSVISSWWHHAILELVTISQSFKTSTQIAKRLGISKLKADQAIKRLEKLELIKFTNSGYKALTETSFTTVDISSIAIKMHHEEHLKNAVKSLYQDKVENREIGSTTIAIDKKQFGEYKELVQEFRKKIAALADNSKNKNSVYLLGTQLFRLDKGDQDE